MYSKSMSAQHTNFVNITFITVSESKYKKSLAGKPSLVTKQPWCFCVKAGVGSSSLVLRAEYGRLIFTCCREPASNPNSELRVKLHRDTSTVYVAQTFTHCCRPTYLQSCQSQQQQMNVHFQRFNGC